MQEMTMDAAIDNLVRKFGKYGIPAEEFRNLMQIGIDKGFSVNAAYNGIVMGFCVEYGEHETFTIEDVMEINGMSRQEVLEWIENERQELIKNGKDPELYFPTVNKQMNFRIKL